MTFISPSFQEQKLYALGAAYESLTRHRDHQKDTNKAMRTKILKKNTINVVTLGCSKNIYDSEVLMGQLQANDKQVVHEKEGNIVVVNTCGFIDNAKEESVQTILNFAKKKKLELSTSSLLRAV